MSKVVIQGDTNGTGVFTVASPNSNTDRTLTLPDAAGTMMLTDTGVTTAQMPAGSVLQVVSVVGPSSSITTSVTAEAVSLSITPTSASSKIFLITTTYASGASGSNTWLYPRFQRNSTYINDGGYFGGSTANLGAPLNNSYLDSPATTSSTTYRVLIGSGSGGTTSWEISANRTTLTAMEIAA